MLLTCSLKTEDEDAGDDQAGRRPLPSSILSLALFCSQDSLPLSLSICFFFFLIFSVFFSSFCSLYLLSSSSWFLFCSLECLFCVCSLVFLSLFLCFRLPLFVLVPPVRFPYAFPLCVSFLFPLCLLSSVFCLWCSRWRRQ